MKLSQIIIETDNYIDYTDIDQVTIEKLSKYKSHYQQWAIKEIRNGHNINSVIDCVEYYINNIKDNRFQRILQRYTVVPKNILTLSYDQLKESQNVFAISKLSRREINQNRSQIIMDENGTKIIKFEKYDKNESDTAKAVSAMARNTKWCVCDVSMANHYLDQAPLYLIHIDGNRYLCHIPSNQLMDVNDKDVLMDDRKCLLISRYIDDFGMFCDNVKSPIYTKTIVKIPYRAFLHAKDVIQGRWPQAEPYILKDANVAYQYSYKVIRARWPQAEPIIIENPYAALGYARNVINGRWPEAESVIIKNPSCAAEYAIYIIRGRWPEAEPYILSDKVCAYCYVDRVIKGRWPKLEKDMIHECNKNIQYNTYDQNLSSIIYNYCRFVLNERWPAIEQYLSHGLIPRRIAHDSEFVVDSGDNTYSCLKYAIYFRSRIPQFEDMIENNVQRYVKSHNLLQNVIEYSIYCIKNRWLKLEHVMIDIAYLEPMKSAPLLYHYALNVIKGRWPEAEHIIMQDQLTACKYAFDVIKGKWPEAEPMIMQNPKTKKLYKRHFGGLFDRWLKIFR